MITPELLDQFLAVFRKHNVMSVNMEAGGDKFCATLGPELPGETGGVPGGWKVAASEPVRSVEQPSDPADPDPLKLGQLDVFTDEVQP